MLMAIIAYIAADLWVNLATQSVNKAILATTLQSALLLGLTYAALWIRDFHNRLVKTMSAIAGSSAIFTLGRYPLISILQSPHKSLGGVVSLIFMGLIIWNAAVLGHVLRSALSLPSWGGAGLAVVYFILYMKVLIVLSIG